MRFSQGSSQCQPIPPYASAFRTQRRGTPYTEQTSQLLVDNVWKRTGIPKAIISDQGPQFAAQVTQELWRKLGIKQKLSTAFHPQTDGELEWVNQVIKQYLCICGNFQQDNWTTLLPIIEFAHNVRPHCSTHQSPFKVWYGF